MEQDELEKILQKLIDGWENEVVEFKEGREKITNREIGKYFSALANEANLRDVKKAWLVFGVNDKTRDICGTSYRNQAPEQLQNLKSELKDLQPNITFRNIHELNTDKGRVVLFEIPSAPRGMPIAWSGHYYGRQWESLGSLDMSKIDEIRSQTIDTDWSAEVIPDATMKDIDDEALEKAKKYFMEAKRNPELETKKWTDKEFLARLRLTINGKLTRAAILLLGKYESAYLLSPHPVEITWKLDTEEKPYEHFSIPLFLATTKIYNKIRNVQIRILPNNELLTREVQKYDQKSLLEAMHNCIAHQDYFKNSRIIVTERIDELTFQNAGDFFEGTPDDYIFNDDPPSNYRNTLLANAMDSLGMANKMGYGILSMHKAQAERYLPLPDYDLVSKKDTVKLTIYGNTVDLAYSSLLIQNTDLPFEDILALDRVQKNLSITDDTIKRLRGKKLIEGRKPNFRVSAGIANVTKSQVKYIKEKGVNEASSTSLIKEYLEKFGEASKRDIIEILKDVLSVTLTPEQKNNRINYLLAKLRKAGVIENTGSHRKPIWKLVKKA